MKLSSERVVYLAPMRKELSHNKTLTPRRSRVSIYWQRRSSVVSASATSSPPVDAFFFPVPIADRTGAAPVVVAFVPLPVVSLADSVPLAVIFVPVPDPDPVSATLVFAAQVPFYLS